ncbi:nicotinate-nucleotide--dimethylbenzimidazole phosphoribosyltransferase-like [Globicephala melas]|uniref:nicotinate-nucleotide--dimethylbenzimidazole phosphoribosyltransferase-like n=1 Tax=Globicephala melas TaxID=9731 RepID=UPI00293D3449|nr:nicotinate-nucleotide--dimethylbenzimidazole phosphoribosyltransferase-like [Globicephala melas]
MAKPKGSLGQLEELALQLAMLQKTLKPELRKPCNIVFCADHGIVEEHISQSPKEITYQVVYNMLNGGAGISFLCRQHQVDLKLVDVGVDYDFQAISGLKHRKIRRGTRNYLYEAAMTESELEEAIKIGEDCVSEVYEVGCNVISFGEMGITNTASSAILMSLICDLPLRDCVGRGSGLDDDGLEHRYQVLLKAIDGYQGSRNPEAVLAYFGGYEMVAAIGAMLRAAELGILILIDGFIMTVCLLLASRFNPTIMQYVIFSHQSDEAGHKHLLAYLKAKPLLSLGLRLGEGSGAICAYPLLCSAAMMMNEMASFEEAKLRKYFD